MNDIIPAMPAYKLSVEKIQEFRRLLEIHLGRTLDESDETVEIWANDLIYLGWTLREITRNVTRRRISPQ